ncbi:YqhG family protein [Salsuginibacillus kocurii]|uniref:YqhG family protein n=1 Tax=Salsuginibacillus kocurii TaxID=427078 RepID=UPI000381CA45|nr:YqhG family protein [Salsuginibacillus kocurii]
MKPEEIYSFMHRFFTAEGADIQRNDGVRITARLNEKLDKALMNRPFYWQYVRAAGNEPEPMTINWTTVEPYDHEEYIYYGSPRLHQLFNYAKGEGKYTKLYQQPAYQAASSYPLEPWLCMNILLSKCCEKREDTIYSFGLQLISGELRSSFMDELKNYRFAESIPDYAFTLSPLIQLGSAYERIRSYLLTECKEANHEWAAHSNQRLEEELERLNSFYEAEEETAAFRAEKEALIRLFSPSIQVQIINSGLFYLQQKRRHPPFT